MNGKIRLGIFGGTFNPPHRGHIESAKNFIEEMSLDKLLIVPTLIPPHKSCEEMATAEQRLEMCELAFSSIPKCEISHIEVERGGKSYTYMTIEELKSCDIELFLLCGTDMILTMDSWMKPEIIFSNATICYARRECDEANDSKIEEKIALYKEKYGAEIVFLDSPVIEISSSEIRNKIKSGESCDGFLTEEVKKYLTDSELYNEL